MYQIYDTPEKNLADAKSYCNELPEGYLALYETPEMVENINKLIFKQGTKSRYFFNY